MALVPDILASYRRPGQVMRQHMTHGLREDRALVFVMLTCALMFVAQWPRLSREASLNPEVPLEASMGAALLGWMFIMPLLLYGLAAFIHLIAKLVGGKGSFLSARLALFWSMLVVAPLWLFQGLVAGFVGPGLETTVTGVAILLLFGWIFMVCLREAERGGTEPTKTVGA